MPGRYYEQWTLGDRIRHQPHRTVTETDNLLISALTHNPQPLHLDETYAEATEFGRIVVNGTFTFALLVGLSVGDTTLGTLVANLGYDKVRMPKPVFIGDTLRAETEVVGLKDSEFAARRRHRHLRAPHVQPARRAGLRDGAHRPDAAGRARESCARSCSCPATGRTGWRRRWNAGADALILDLEDAVAPAAKAGGAAGPCRALSRRHIRARGSGCGSIRSTAPETEKDLQAVLPAHPDGIVLPKAEGGASVDRADPAPDRARQRHRPDPRHRHRDAGRDLPARQLWRRTSGSPA